jgi:FKBP-type peptidyl-prolyl cis-trans isomerase
MDMKQSYTCWLVVLSASMALSAAWADTNSQLNYAWAAKVAKENADNSVQVDENVFLLGLDDGYHNRRPVLSEAEAGAYFSKQMKDIRFRRRAEAAKLDAEMVETDKQLTALVEKKPALKKLKDGLYYEVITPGKGKLARFQDEVKLQYTAKRPDGTQILSASPAFVTQKMYLLGTGVSEALQHMVVGATWRLYMVGEHTKVVGAVRYPVQNIFNSYNGAVIADISLSAVNANP